MPRGNFYLGQFFKEKGMGIEKGNEEEHERQEKT